MDMFRYFLSERLAAGQGERAAVLFGERCYTYRNIHERATALSSFLQHQHFRPEERVLLLLPDTPAFVWSLFGSIAAGGVVCMANPDVTAESLRYLLDYTRARFIFTPESVAREHAALFDVGADVGQRTVLVTPDVSTGADVEVPVSLSSTAAQSGATFIALCEAIEEGRASSLPPLQLDDCDPAMWLFTSGSTGTPKAAVHCHRDFIFNTEKFAKDTIGVSPQDVTVSVPRLYFGYATGTNLFFPFAMGASVGLFCERPTPQRLADAVRQYRATVVTNVPTMLGKLLDFAAEGNATDFSSVRFQYSAGEALPAALYNRCNELFGTPIYDGIGSAEMFHIYITNRPGDVKLGSLGKIVDGYEAKILPPEAEGPGAPAVPAGETGVLWIKGDSVAVCYHGDRDKSYQTFFGHWCRTGDLFSRDEAGYYWFKGRADNLFKVSGKFVSPVAIEDSILAEDVVSAVCVVGREQDGLMKPVAFVVRKPGDTSEEAQLHARIKRRVQNDVGMHAYPRWIKVVSDLPKNDRGKLDRKQVALLAQSLGIEV